MDNIKNKQKIDKLI